MFKMLISIAVALLLLMAPYSWCIPLDRFYPFGTTEGDLVLPNSVYSRFISSETFSFFGISRSFLYMNPNGIITFSFVHGEFFPPRPLPFRDDSIIAPYWFSDRLFDDESDNGSRSLFFNNTENNTSIVYYRHTSDNLLLERVSTEIKRVFPDAGGFRPTSLFIATWKIVEDFLSDMDNVFQCVIAISGKETFVMFHYVDGLFETIDEIFDGNTTVQAGLNAGDGRRFVTIPGSGTEDIVDISNKSNVDIPGVWIFQTNEILVKHPVNDSPVLVDVTTANVPTINQPLTLTCSVATVRQVTSRVDIIWISDNTQVKRHSNLLASNIGTLSVYNDSLLITSSLSIDDIGSTHKCEVVINTIPVITATSNITVPIPPAVECRYSPNAPLDLVFVIDESGSIGLSRFQLIREFTANIVADVVGSSPRSRVGVILFDGDAHIHFDLHDHTSLSTLLPAINPGLPYNGGGTDTADALRLLLSSARNGRLRIRSGVPNVAIVITDGRSNNQFATVSAAATLHALNLFDVYAVGVGGADISELNAIASDPEFIFFSNQFNSIGLKQLQQSIIEAFCAGGPIIVFQPNGLFQNTKGRRQDIICSITVPAEDDLDTVELEWLNGDNITTGDGRITIISADNSTSLKSSTLSTILRFDPLFEDDQGNYTCYSVVNDTLRFQTVELANFNLPNPIVLITTLDDQVLGDSLTLDCTVTAVIGISSAVDIIWTIDDKIVRRVNDISASINSNSAVYTDRLVLPELTALDNGRTYQCTVLINRNPPAKFSKKLMLDFYAPVCFNTTSCDGESVANDSVSFNDSFSFNQCCFELSGVAYASNGQCILCPTTDCTIDVVKDIVFVIDTTSSIGNVRFQMIREFIASLTTNLKLNSPESRVGVILFDWLVRLQFNLQRHTSLSALLPAINPGLPYYGSSSYTSTAGALQYLLSSAQNGALGIRNGTSNIAILITDGQSVNQVHTQYATAAIHSANIFDIYAIGFGNADISELHTIASDPEFVYFTNFSGNSTLEQLEMNLTDQLCSVPSPGISLQPSGYFSSTIGQMQDLVCSVTITSAIDPDSVQLTWLGSNKIITSDNRVTVIPTTVTSNAFSFTYTAILQFAYLMEGDEGNYTCDFVADDMFESQTVHLQNLRIPFPVVEVTTLNTPTLGQSTTLRCNAISVRGISSRVDIIWRTGSTIVRRVDGILPNITNRSAVYSDLLTTPLLHVSDDGRAYQCTVIFNSCTSANIMRNKFIVLDFPVPSCYITSGCSGNPLNQTITFSECCTKFSGVTYDLGTRCQPCPISPNCTFEAVKDVVFVVDTSSSIGFSRFQLVREFIENITATLKANSPESLVGVILFDDYARLHFNISKHTDLSTLLPAINPGLPYNRGYRTDTARALDLLRVSAQNGALRLRNETSNVAIVITDGYSRSYYSRSYYSTQSAASRLHATNIFDIYTIGIGRNSLYELRSIASDRSLVFSTSYFNSISAQRILEDITKPLCSTPLPRTFLDPDISQGVIGEAIDIVCTMTVTSTVDTNLVDLSWVGITSSNRITVIPTALTTDDSLGNIYTTIVRFAYLMEGDEGNYKCNLMIQDSLQSTVRLDLTIPAPIVNVTTVDDMVYGEPLQLYCTVTAARGVTSDVNIRWFEVNNLLRSTRVRTVTVTGNVSNSAVVYEDSLLIPLLNTSDRFSDYRCEAFIFSSVQVVNGSGSIELDFQAPSCYLNTRCTGNPIGTVTTDFSDCCNVLTGVAFTLGRHCRLCPATDCPFQARDVVFVLDNSYAIGSYKFQFARDFTESISIALKVGSPNTSVGVILFGRNAHIQFSLKEHTSLETLLSAIDGLPYDGSYPTSTDIALKLLLSSAQNGTLGLRADTTKIAIVFTAGRSRYQYSTQRAAHNLHIANIYDVYAVGIDRADYSELLGIASDPRFVYRRSSFYVQQPQQLVINQLCTIPPPIVKVVAPFDQVVGQSLTLQCNIMAVSDIASTVDVIWTNGDTEVRKIDNVQGSLINNFTDYFTIPSLTRHDNNEEYHCRVVINTIPPITGNDSVVLIVTQPPQMIISPSQSPHTVNVGTQLLLYCAAEGLSIPTVQWYSDGVPVHPLQQLYQQVYLVPTDSPHTTVYTCMGRNHAKGIDHVTQANITVIIVEEQPCPALKAPIDGSLTITDDGKFAFFTCRQSFNIRGSYVLQCINGRWNYNPPLCSPVPKVCQLQCDL